MYVILTSKPGQFRTEIVDGLRPLQAYDYLFYGIRKATFVIAELVKETKIRVVDETGAADRQQCAVEISREIRNARACIPRAAASDHVRHDGHVAAKAVEAKQCRTNPP